MPQDPKRNLDEIDWFGSGPPGVGPSFQEQEFSRTAFERMPTARTDPFRAEAAVEKPYKALSPEAQKRLDDVYQALKGRIESGKRTYQGPEQKRQVAESLSRLNNISWFEEHGADVMANFGPGLAGFADTLGDIGATVLGVGQAPAAQPEQKLTPDQANERFFKMGFGLSDEKPRHMRESGILEAVAGGAKTTQEAREKMRSGMLAKTAGFTEADRKVLEEAIQRDMMLREEGLPGEIPDKDIKRFEKLYESGALGEVAGLAELISLLRLGPGQIGAKVAQRTAPALGPTGARMVGEGTAFGLTEGLREGSMDAAQEGGMFGMGMGAAGAGIDRLVGSVAAERLLAAQWLARNRVSRYIGRSLGETAKLRAGRLSASLLPGGETPMDALGPEGLGGEALFGAAFGLGGGRSMRRVERRIDINQRRQASRARGAQNEARRTQAEAESAAAAERARRGQEEAQANEERAELEGLASEIEGRFSEANKERTTISPREARWARMKIEEVKRGETLSESDNARLREIRDILSRGKARAAEAEARRVERDAERAARKAEMEAKARADEEMRELQRQSDNMSHRQRQAAIEAMRQRLDADFRAKEAARQAAATTKPADAPVASEAPVARPERQFSDFNIDSPWEQAKNWARDTRNRMRAEVLGAEGGSAGFERRVAKLSPKEREWLKSDESANVGTWEGYARLVEIESRVNRKGPAWDKVARERDKADPAYAIDPSVTSFNRAEGRRIRNWLRAHSLDSRASEAARKESGRLGRILEHSKEHLDMSPREWQEIRDHFETVRRDYSEWRRSKPRPEPRVELRFDPVKDKYDPTESYRIEMPILEASKVVKDSDPELSAKLFKVWERMSRDRGFHKKPTAKQWAESKAAYAEAERIFRRSRGEAPAAATPAADPRDRLSEKGYELLDEFVAAAEQAPDAASYEKLRTQFERKLVQKGKWAPEISKATPEVRAAEASRILERIDAEASERVKAFQRERLGVDKEAELLEQLAAAKTEKQRAKIQRQIDALAKSEELKVDRRAAGQEATNAETKGKHKKGSKAVQVKETVAAKSEVSEERVKRVEALERVRDEMAELGEENARRLVQRLTEDPSLDIATEIARMKADPGLSSRFRRSAGGGEAGFVDFGAALKGAIGLAKAIANPVRFVRAFNAKYPKWSDFGKAVSEWLFGRKPGMAATQVNVGRRVVEKTVGMSSEEIVTLTPDGPAKQVARDFKETGDLASIKKQEFMQRDDLLKSTADAADGAASFSKAELLEMTTPTSTTGPAEAPWMGRFLRDAPKDATERSFFKSLYDVIAKAWDNAQAMGFLKDGKPLPNRGTAPYLPDMPSQQMIEAYAEAGVGSWLKRVIEEAKTDPRNSGLKPDEIEKIILSRKQAFSGDVQKRIASERHHAIEYDRLVTLPDYVDGIPTRVTNPQEYLRRYATAIQNRVGFESAMRGRDLAQMRAEFVAQGGDGRLFDDWATQAQGQWKNYQDIVEGNEFTSIAGKVAGEAIGLTKTAMLSGSAVPNAAGLVWGPMHRTFGAIPTWKAVGQELGLEVNRFVRNLANKVGIKVAKVHTRDMARAFSEIEPYERLAPHAYEGAFQTAINTSRVLRSVISRFLIRPINRLADRVSRRAMANFLDELAQLKAAGKQLPKTRIERIQTELGLTDAQVQNLLSGKATEAEKSFLAETASQVIYGAARSPQSLSRAQKNPVIRTAIWFASHATKQARLLVRAYDRTVRDWKESAGKPMWQRTALTGMSATRNIGGNLAAQTISGTAQLIALAATHGDFIWEGDDSAVWKSLTERPGEFFGNALLAAGVYGPMGMALSRISGMDSPGEMLQKIVTPMQQIDNARHWAMGTGPYAEVGDIADRSLLALQRTPATRIGSTLMAVAGLTDKNVDTDNGIRAHYSYLRDKGILGRRRQGSPDEVGHAAMRTELKKSLDAMVRGRPPEGLLLDAIKAKGEDVRRVAASLRGMKLVEDIKPEQMGAYRQYMGDRQFEALLRRDALIELWAQAILKSAGKKPAKTDEQIQAQIARVEARLPRVLDADRAWARAVGISERVHEIARAKRRIRRGASGDALGTARSLASRRAERELKGFDAQLVEGTRRRLGKRLQETR